MGLGNENVTILVKLLEDDHFVSRRKRERLITPQHPTIEPAAAGAPATETAPAA